MKALMVACLSLVLVSPLFGQYQFDSKELEDIYYKLEEAYAEYNYDEILANEDRTLELVETRQDTLTALVYSFLGEAYLMGMGDYTTGLEFYEKELVLRTKIQSDEDYDSKSLFFNIATIKDEMGEYEEAEKIYLDLLVKDLKEFGRESPEYLETIDGLGRHYLFTQQYDEAVDSYKQSLKGLDKDSEYVPRLLSNLASAYSYSGQYNASEKMFFAALQSYEDQGRYATDYYASTLIAMGLLYQNTGRYPLAEEVLNEALEIIDRLPGDYGDYAASAYSNLGLVYWRLGNFGKAREIFEENIKLDEEFFGTENANYALSLMNLGAVQSDMQDFRDAESSFKLAREIFEKVNGEKTADYGYATGNLAKLYKRRGQYIESLKYVLEANNVYARTLGANHPSYAYSLSNTGDVYMSLNDLKKAEELYEDAFKIRKSTLGINHPLYAESTNELAVVNWAKDKEKRAEEFYKLTFNNYFNQIDAYFPTLSEEEKAKFYYTKLKITFEEFNSFAIEQSATNKSLIGDMYDYQLGTKALVMYATNKVRESIMNSGDQDLIEKYDQWIGVKESLARLYSNPDIPLEERNSRIDSLNDISNTFEKELSAESQTFASTYSQSRLTWRDVQKTLKKDEAAVEIIRFRRFVPQEGGKFTNEAFYAALIVREDTRDYPELVLFKNGDQMESRYLANYRNAIRFQIQEDYSYDVYWRAIADKLSGIKKIYFSPDGVYNQLSIYTLRNPKTDQYAIDEIEIQLVTNTKDLLSFSEEPATRDVNRTELIGFPNYNLGSAEELLAMREKAAKDITTAASLGRGSRSAKGANNLNAMANFSVSRGLRANLQDYTGNSTLAILPGTKKEIELIVDLYQGTSVNTEVLMDNEALESKLKNVDNPSTLHIATHGFFLEDNGDSNRDGDEYVQNPLLRSGLILAGANSYLTTGEFMEGSADPGEDGILTAYEAMNLNLDDTDLVVMSACETGLGDVKNGEGVYGLQRAFQIAGAKSVIMSMWTVDDAATQELMTVFYDEWLKGGDKHSAFIKAQQQIKKKYDSPYYWGAFVMVGE